MELSILFFTLSDFDEFLIVIMLGYATAEFWSWNADIFFLTSWHKYLLEFVSDLQLEDICSWGWKAGENVLITWFSIADKQDKLYQVYAAPALTN